MDKWILSAEFFSLVLILILVLNFYEKKRKGYAERRLYQVCLWMSVGAIALNILCTFTIAWAWAVPLWVNLALNSGYFFAMVCLSSLTAYYIACLLFQHVYQPRGLRYFAGAVAAMCGLYFLLLVYNLRSGLLFFFDDQRLYHRGPLVNTGYLILGLELGALVVFSLRSWRSLSLPMRRVMKILPPTVALLTAYQLAFPEVLFNGGIIVAANIILLINFQSRRLEQDALTLVGSRASFYQDLSLRLAGDQQFQVVMVALRRFGEVNQRYGHRTGDAVLYEAALWLERLHPAGSAFRVGNVSFGLLVPYTGPAAADRLLDQVHRRFCAPWQLGEAEIRLECRFAELIRQQQDWNATDVMEFLNYSLSEAEGQKSGLVRFDSGVYRRMEQRTQLLRQMRRAVREDGFEVWYQPLRRCATGAFASAEALVRMRDEGGELVSPAVFIPLAEQNGLIEEISRIVLEKVCRLLGSGHLPRLEAISVNLSMEQLVSGNLAAELAGCLERYGVDPRQLKLEITERVLAEDAARMRAVMEQITAMGVEFCLDDFGTGYSNLSVVLGCSFGCVKLDHSLIRRYPDQERAACLVNTMLELFHSMGCQVVAEGVETARQAQALESQGADWLQGYYCARPMPEGDFVQLLQSQPVPAGREN